jgi:CO dehydrogenase nickel-insertion accessory protein CooC1
MTVGLGADDILQSNKCAHAHIAPLKFYLPLLDTKPSEYIVIDGVAGVDMMNYGLYLGVDLIIGVVEPHGNSIRVYEEVRRIAELSNIPTRYIINTKYSRYSEIDIEEILNEQPLAVFYSDPAIRDFNYKDISQENLDSAENVIHFLNELKKEDAIQRLKNFEMSRQV